VKTISAPGLRLRRTESGIQLVGLFHEDHDDKAVAAVARAHGVNVSPLSIQYRHGEVQRGLLMGFAAADEKTTKKRWESSEMFSELQR
jgi:GntR family transcriptional regulator / MocR family aminotransferase